jgi:glycerol-3-phosphate dehydrogenase
MPAPLSAASRAAALAELGGRVVDLLVVGGGITGAGIARDAALAGLDVLLVEAVDFAAGTSSRSSKLIHGGIRYLEQGEVALVREAATERAIVRRIAPHLARPLRMVMPATRHSTLLKLRAGVWAFEHIAGEAAGDPHETWSREEALRHEPCLAPERLVGAIAFTEYLTDDARLVLANVRSAALAGATCMNHVAVVRLAAGAAALEDRMTGARLEVRARAIVNAAGPWVGAVQRLAEVTTGRALQLTKGIHLVLRRARLPLEHAVVMTARDRRSVFAVPRDDMVYLGTTDTLAAAPEVSPDVGLDDVDYLLDAAHRTFSGEPLAIRDVSSAWAGLRPLLSEPGKKPSEISRRDEIMVDEATGLVTIAGGKLTTYRRMAERVVDVVCRRLGRPRGPGRTGEDPLPGGEAAPPSPDALRAHLPTLDDAAAARLARLYGTEARSIAARAASHAPSETLPPLLRAEVEHAIDREMALTLEDLLERRTRLLLFDPAQGLPYVDAVATLAASRLGWDAERTAAEIAQYRALAGRLRSFA